MAAAAQVPRSSTLQHHFGWQSKGELFILRHVLKVPQLSMAQYLQCTLLQSPGNLLPVIRLEMAAYLLTNLNSLASEDTAFMNAARSSAFVQTQGGSLRSPRQLFDPRDPDLRTVFQLHVRSALTPQIQALTKFLSSLILYVCS